MSQGDPPLLENTVSEFEDKPIMATMVSGGFFIALILYFISDRLLSNVSSLNLQIIPPLVFIIIIISSIRKGLQIDVRIKINTRTGWIYAENRRQYWEGYINEVANFQVLQRQIETGPDKSIIKYKLHLELEDKSKYEIPLTYSQVAQAISDIEEATNSIPTKAKIEEKSDQNLLNI